MSEYAVSDDLARIATKVITENEEFSHLDNNSCRIAFQTCDSTKTSSGKTVYADTERVKDKLKALLPYDFIVTFYADSEDLSEEAKERLMYHELKHVGFDPERLKYSIIPHDIEDFRAVLEKWGVDWLS